MDPKGGAGCANALNSQMVSPSGRSKLDLWIAADPENAERAYRALTEFGAPVSGHTPRDFTDERSWFQIGVAPVRVDIMLSLPGISFEEAWGRRVEAEFLGAL